MMAACRFVTNDQLPPEPVPSLAQERDYGAVRIDARHVAARWSVTKKRVVILVYPKFCREEKC